MSSPATNLRSLPSMTSNNEKMKNVENSLEVENLKTGNSSKRCASRRQDRVADDLSTTKDKTYDNTYECKVVLRRLPIKLSPVNGKRKQFDPGKEDTPLKPSCTTQRCKFCDKTFDTKSKLWDHISEHLEIDAKLSLSKNKSCQFPDCNIKNCNKKTILEHLAFNRRGIYEIDSGSITLFNNGTKDFYKASKKISSSIHKDNEEKSQHNRNFASQNSLPDLPNNSKVTKHKANSRIKGKHEKKSPSFVESYLFEKCPEGSSGDDETTDTEYTVESILDKRITSKSHEYLVKWKGYSEEESTWEPAHSLDCFHLIKAFQANFSVDRIADMRKSTKKRDVSWSGVEYLVKWKGFDRNYDTWEPLEVLSCHELIREFKKRSAGSDKTIRSILDDNKSGSKKLNTAMKKLKGFRTMLSNHLSEMSSDTDTSSEDDLQLNTVQKIVGSRVVGQMHEYLIKWKGLETEHNTWEMAENLNSWDLIITYQRFWDIDKVLDKRFGKGKESPWNWSGIEYLVKWKGFDDQYNTWEPIDILGCVEEIKKFEKNNLQNKHCTRELASSNGNGNSLKNSSTIETRLYKNKKTREEFIVEKIKDRRITSDGTLEYLIKWRCFGDNYDDDHTKLMGITWEPLENLECNELIRQFENENHMSRSRKQKPNVPRTIKNHSKNNVTASFPSNQICAKRSSNVDIVHEAYDHVDEYAVESILERNVYSTDKVEYRVKWKGFSDTENTWEPANNLYCFDLIKTFLSTYRINTIIKKRVVEVEENVNRTGIEYLVKWKGYSSKYNTWEPLEVLDCNDLIREYEKTTLNISTSTKKCRAQAENVAKKNKSKKDRNITTSIGVTKHLKKKRKYMVSNEKEEYENCRSEKLENNAVQSKSPASEVKVIHFAKSKNSHTTMLSHNDTNVLEPMAATENEYKRNKRRKVTFED